MKKGIIVLLIAMLLIGGCAVKKKKQEYDKESREKIVNDLGKSSDSRIVIKVNKSDALQYYVYELNNINFVLYNYTFYDTVDEFQNDVDKMKDNRVLELEQNKEALFTKILMQKGSKSDDSKDLRSSIIDKYKDNKDYEIIT